MSGYELRNRDDGTVELVETIPTVIATFTDRGHAERYYNYLTETGGPERPKPCSALPAPTASTPIEKPVVPAWSQLSDGEWASAFQAVEAGEDMKAVAKRINVNFYKLRGKYANWRRQKKEQPQPAVQHPEDECRICGREFKAAAESDGLCARCSRV